MWRRSASGRIPLGDAVVLGPQLRRARAVRRGLAVALAVVALAALVTTLRLRESAPRLLPADSSGLIVLDVSSSITSSTYRQIDRVLADAVAGGGRYGLVLFSDVAYEALPPGTSAAELRPFRRFFTPLKGVEAEPGYPTISVGNLPFPENPWEAAFAGGTRISSGLTLALEVLRRERIDEGSVLLVSDLGDDASDLPALSQALIALRRADVPLRVVALGPTRDDKLLFERLLGGDGTVTEAPEPPRTILAEPPSGQGVEAPVAFAAAALVLFGLLLANEVMCGRLTWGSPAR